MIVYLRTESGLITADQLGQSPITAIEAKRSTDLDIYVSPDVELPLTTPGFFAAAPLAGGAPVALASWSAPASLTSGWSFSVSLRGASLAAMFSAGTTSVQLNAEITAIITGKRRKSQTMQLVVTKEVHNEDEDPAPTDLVNTRRTNSDGYQEYSFDQGASWWLYAPVIVDGSPEWQWRLLP